MPAQLLFEYLERQHANFTRHQFLPAYTAPEMAQNSHIAGRSLAKVVMVKSDGELIMVVLPAHYHIDLPLLGAALGSQSVELASEREFARRFPRCEVGAMPPFGHLYGLQTYMAPVFNPGQSIAFKAGSHSEIVRMPMREFLRLAHVTELDAGVMPPALTPPRMQYRRPRMRL